MKRLSLLMPALLAACAAVGPDHQRPEVALPASYPLAAEGTVALQADWWTLYGDAELNRLVARALQANTGIAQAAARVEQALAVEREARGSRIGSSGSARTVLADGTGLDAQPDASLALSAAYELDFWGRLRRGDQAARAQLLASRAAADTVRLTVASLVAQAWFGLGSLDAQAAALRSTLKSREEAVRIIGLRLQGGTVSRLDLEQAELLRSDAALQLRDLQRQRALVVSQLGVLTADPALALPAGPALRDALPPLPPAGLPSALLERRPDVQRAEQLLAAASAQIGVARAAMFPQITLTGFFGGDAVELAEVLKNPGRFWSLGVGLALPLFDGGRLAARVDQAGAAQREAVAAYQGAVGTAFQEVSDALANLSAARESQAELLQRERTAERALKLAQARFDAGYAGYLELLEAQRTSTAAQLGSVRNRQSQLNASVDLMKALGGGWQGFSGP